MFRIFKKKDGTTIEVAVLFMLITLALGAIIISYSGRISAAGGKYTDVNRGKLDADAIAAAFLAAPERLDTEKYGEKYSFVTDGEGSVLDVYYRSELIECVKVFADDPIYCQMTYNFSYIAGYSVRVVWEVNPSAPALEVYYGNSRECILKIFTERAEDENGIPYPSKTDGYYLYRPTRVSRSEHVQENGSFTIRWSEPQPYTFGYMRAFYRKNAEGLIYLETENGRFIQYEYGAN